MPAKSRWWPRVAAGLVLLAALLVANVPTGLPTEAAQATPQPRVTVPRGAGRAGLSPTLLGDINNDGIVDIRDYGIWRQQFGATDCGNRADLNGDCIVDIRDYGVWRANFGRTVGAAPPGGAFQAGLAPAPRGTPGPALLAGDRAVAGYEALLPADRSSPAVPIVPLVGGLLGVGGLAG